MQRRTDDLPDSELLKADTSPDDINDRIDRPHFVEMDVFDRNPVNFRFRFAEAAKDRQCPLFYSFTERRTLYQSDNL